MLIGLATDETSLLEYFQRTVLLSPCTVVGTEADLDLSEEAMNKLGLAQSRDILSAPTTSGWDDTLALVCSEAEPELNETYCENFS